MAGKFDFEPFRKGLLETEMEWNDIVRFKDGPHEYSQLEKMIGEKLLVAIFEPPSPSASVREDVVQTTMAQILDRLIMAQPGTFHYVDKLLEPSKIADALENESGKLLEKQRAVNELQELMRLTTARLFQYGRNLNMVDRRAQPLYDLPDAVLEIVPYLKSLEQKT